MRPVKVFARAGPRVRGSPGRRFGPALLFLAQAALLGPAQGVERDAATVLEAAVAAVCDSSSEDGIAVARALEGAILLDTEPMVFRGQPVGARSRFLLNDGAQVYLERLSPGGRLQRVTLVYHAPYARQRRPEWMILADGECRVLTGRRLVYDGPGAPAAIERTDASLKTVEVREPLNPPVPEGYGPDTGVRVALVDSGVNYLLEGIRRRLARDTGGAILGFDYWDLDPRPFDSHPARSAFFPQRHGTQTAGVIIADSPVASLVPYRYPRPAMSRMVELVEDAASKGVRIVNLSLGGKDADAWAPFAEAARRHPEMLFIASAGNDGRDIDGEEVYPAALELENLVTATSASDTGLPAEGSNWGAKSVDFLVPAEDLVSIDFYGRPKLVSGSSYAAARVSALAACLLAANPDWRAPELKAAIIARVKPSMNDVMRFVAYGFLGDPTRVERGACAAEPADVVVLSEIRLGVEALYPDGRYPQGVQLTLRAAMVVLEGTTWSASLLESVAADAAELFLQCGVGFSEVRLYRVRAPRRLAYFNDRHAAALVSGFDVPRPAVFFVSDTVQEIPFDAEAIGRSNGRSRPALVDTAWMTEAVGHSGIALAHELYHVLADSGSHSDDPGNLMYAETLGTNTRLDEAQCWRLQEIGAAFGHLKALE